MSSKPATVAQSGPVRLPVKRTPRRGVTRLSARANHRFTVGDALCIMSWERNTYDMVTVVGSAGFGLVVVREDTDGWERTYDTSCLVLLAGQAYAHHGRGPETPGVGLIVPAEGMAHSITTAGRCLTCDR